VIKSRRMRWTGHVARAYRVLVEETWAKVTTWKTFA
jgi:hypothetical protein